MTFPNTSLKWDKSISDDVSEYHIFRSMQSNDMSFEILDKQSHIRFNYEGHDNKLAGEYLL